MLDALAHAAAARWHARRGPSLFKSEGYADVMGALSALHSRLFSFNPSRIDFEHSHLVEQWTAIRTGPLAAAWNTDSSFARALFAYLDRLGRALDAEFARGLQMRVIMNRVDWRPETVDASRGVACLGIEPRGRGGVWCIVDPTQPQARAYAELLALVDSEAWAWGRLQTRVIPSAGKTVRDAMLDWVEAGRPEQIVVGADDMLKIIEGASSSLADYWMRWANWASTGEAVELDR